MESNQRAVMAGEKRGIPVTESIYLEGKRRGRFFLVI